MRRKNCRKEEAVARLRELYGRYGYSQYRMRKFEEYDLYVRNKDFLLSDHMITFTEPSGKLMALKPDVTLSIAKSFRDTPGSMQKVYYQESVYRVDKDSHAFKEITQVGLECMGDGDDYSMVEVLLLAAESLRAIGEDFVLDISHLGIVSSVWEAAGVPGAYRQALLRCLGEKNAHEAAALCREAHELGMKIVLDDVFSHVGDRSPYFQSAAADKSSPYYSWFQWKHWPDDYESWWGIKTLPCIDKSNPDFIRYIIEDEDSVVAKWLRLGADGFRLDVVDELPDAFVARLRRRVRELNPEAILIGEVWEDASNKIAYGVRRRYFTDCQLDAVMNYPWQKAILRYVRGDEDGAALGESIRTLAENYPPDVLNAVMNILSTHDTPRALTALIDPTDASREELATRQLRAESRAWGLTLLRMAAFLQFMLPGAPCVYYGDEAGMDGYRDPFNRRFYPWGHEDTQLRAFYKALMQLKKTVPPLRRGRVDVLQAGGGRLLLYRRTDEQTVVVCCNRSGEPWELSGQGQVLLGFGLREITGEHITLDSFGFCAIVK